MARPLRLEFPGAVYHVTSRGNHDQHVFLNDEHRKAFLEIVGETVKRYNWRCHAFCLLDNHYHLVIETPDGNLAKGMRQVNAVYTQYFNRHERKGGHLFQGRYKAVLVEKEVHLLEVIRHVLRAPVAAGLAGSPEDYEWSSFAAVAGSGKKWAFVSCGWIRRQFRGRPEGPEPSFAHYVAEASGDPFSQVRGQVLLGTDEFCRKLKPVLSGHQSDTEIPVVQRLVGRPALSVVFSGVDKKNRDERIVEAVERWAYSQKEVADHLKLHYSTVSRIMKKPTAGLPSAPNEVEEGETFPKAEESPGVPVVPHPGTVDEITEVARPVSPESSPSQRKTRARGKRETSPEDDQLALF